MLLLAAVSGVALAATDPVADAILAARERMRGPVLVCPAGPEAEKAVQHALRDHAHLDIPVRRIPTAGDISKETATALAASGLACALRVEAAGPTFAVVEVGQCEGPARVVLAVAPDPDAAAGADADPAAEDDPPEPVSEDEWITRQARYDRERLLVVDLPPDPARDPALTWEIVDGAGVSPSARRIAEIANDDDLVFRLEDELRRSRRASRAVLWTGIGLALISPAPLLGVESGAVQANQDRLWSSVFLLSSAGLTMALSGGPRKATRAHQEEPARYLDGDTAEDLATQWNRALWTSLDLDQRPLPDEETDDAPAPGEEAAASGAERGPPPAPARVIIGAGTPTDGGGPDDGIPDGGDARDRPDRIILEGGDGPADPAVGAPAPTKVILGEPAASEPPADMPSSAPADAAADTPADTPADPGPGEEASSDR
jgi:hypothetical protein